MKAPPALPACAQRFLRTNVRRRTRLLVYSLHRWLDERQWTIGELTPARLSQYLARPWKVRTSTRVRFNYRNLLRGYLQWLFDRGLVGFVPESRRRRPLALPALAHAFLAFLTPTHRPATRLRYGYSLRKLYGWAQTRGRPPECFTRDDIVQWFQALHTSGLHATSRSHILADVRSYLHWLSEQRRMRTAPDALIRTKDIPKLPLYLPRPLTVEADRELQQRLFRAAAPGAWALLLMRQTGLRIGELRNLEYHCIRDDARRPMLKVPLGKLHNERLVPLSPDAVALIRRLQATAPRPRAWLVHGFGGSRMSYDRIRRLLTVHSHGLSEPTRITTHRLRHTYATEMLSAGMSLPGVMRLLGHRDIKMTMRYAAVTPEVVADEYAKALAQLTAKYQLRTPPARPAAEPDADTLLDQLARWLRKNAPSPPKALLLRVARLRREVQKFQTTKKPRQ